METQEQSLVSIVITTFNAEKFLKQTLESIFKQTYKAIEIVIVDDGSSDTTPDIIKNLSRKHPKFSIVVELGTHRGRIASLNQAIQKTKGDYIAICDADDLFFPEKTSEQVAFLESHPTIGLCGTDALAIDPHGEKIKNIVMTSAFSDVEIRHAITGYNPFIHSSIMYRREALLQEGVKPYSERFIPGFEWEVYIKIMMTWEVANLPNVLVAYRIHDNNLTKKRKPLKRLINVTQARWYVYQRLQPKYRHWRQLFYGFFDLFIR